MQAARIEQAEVCPRTGCASSACGSMVVNRFEALRSGTTPLVGRDEELDLPMCRRTDFSAQNLMCVSSLIRVKKRTMIDGR
jgi:hypothetical protein